MVAVVCLNKRVGGMRSGFADRWLEGGVLRFPAEGEEAANMAVMKFDISFAESTLISAL